MNKSAAAFVSGALFAVGLGISGMTQPQKVLAFLDLTGHWDPSLAFVMAGAVAANLLLIRLGRRLPGIAGGPPAPLQSDAGTPAGERGPLAAQIAAALRDRRLLVGSAAFGVGWGLVGFCPGPALVSAASGLGRPLIFIGAMVLGMAAYRYTPAAWSHLRGEAAAGLVGPTAPQECGTA